MKALDKTLRKKLENTIIRARETAEEAAKSAIEQLGVEQSNAYVYLTFEKRELRRKLRAHGRQLGDERDQKTGTQEIVRLTGEVAYEHWHRMLFARFLAENELLMFYDDNDIDNAVAVSLDECEEMATEMKCSNGWELAAKLAGKMLPQIFRAESPVFELQFSPEKLRGLEILLSELVSNVFTASDSLGWAYQFWQCKKKEEINYSGNKIGASELPAVTQLFTEPYMVSFLLDNSLGAWWAKKRLSENDLKNAMSEDELRNKISLPGIPLEYLRFIKGENGYWSPAGGAFEGWPDQLSELKVLDPCCGSGHFLVSAFLMLVPIRMELEGFSAREACDAVLNDNIHGLEIDQRCVELAAFALALTAWKYPNASGFRKLPDLQIAWCGQSVNVKKEDWVALAEGDKDLSIHLEGLYDLFQDSCILGSLLNPKKAFEEGSIFEKDWKRVSKVLQAKLESKKNDNDGLVILAQGMEKTFQLLSEKYHLVITNVPYLVRGKQVQKLQEFCEKNYEYGKNDLATTFLQRCLEFCNKSGNSCIVLPQTWLFQQTYKRLRKSILQHNEIKLISKLGEGGFENSAAAGAFVILIIIGKLIPICNKHPMIIIDATDKGREEKKNTLESGLINIVLQEKQLKNPDYRIAIDFDTTTLLLSVAASIEGLSTGDSQRYIQLFWEQGWLCYEYWSLYQSSPESKIEYSGLNSILRWENGNGTLSNSSQARVQGFNAWGKKGVLINLMRSLHCSLYLGEKHDKITAAIIPEEREYIDAIWVYCLSNDFYNQVRNLNPALQPGTSTLVKVPFDIDYWKKNAQEKYPNGIPKPYSNDPTQWIFHGQPENSEAPLQVAVARLLGYRWPAEMDTDLELSDESRELVRKCCELLPYADEDGIVCIPPVRGETSASERLLNLLAKAYKGQDINVIVSELLASCDHAGKGLDSWLREKFFSQHLKIFGHRPFIWHIWDGLSDGFAALVNYHKLDRKNLETLTYTYLGDWINKQKAEITAGVDGAEEKLEAAETLKKSLELILEGEAPYDIFVRWKPIQSQSIGWEPDINDGVRMNIRPFILVPDLGKRGAGILRDKPNIKWDKDRGKNISSSPWYQLFNGDRINDYHLSLGDKEKARAEMKEI